MTRNKMSVTRRRFNKGASASIIAVASDWSGAAVAAAAPKRGGTLRVARTEAIDGFKLDGQITNATYQVSQAVMEPLLRFNPDGRSVDPGLAESYSMAADGRSITLRLAKEVKFSDGRPVTPADVTFSVDLWKKGPNYGPIYSVIKSVTTLDDRTVRFDLASPNTSLPAFLTWSIAGIVPKDFDGRSEQDFWLQPIGAGPFMVKHWQAAGDIAMVRNPHYYRPGLPYVDTLISSLPDVNQQVLQFRSREVDIVEEISALYAPRFPGNRRIESPTHFTDVLLFNTKYAPFNDVRVRRAMALAIDYSAIANGLYKGFAEYPTGFLPPNIGMWAPPDKPYFRQNLVAARKLVAVTGLANKTFELTYPVGFGLISQIVQRSLQMIGVQVKLVPTDTGTFVSNTYSGKFQLAIWSYNAISPSIADPVSFILSTNYFFTGYPPQHLQAALQTFFAGKTVAEKRAAVVRMQNQGEEEIPFVALDHYHITTAVQAGIHGVRPSPWGSYYYDGVWKE